MKFWSQASDVKIFGFYSAREFPVLYNHRTYDHSCSYFGLILLSLIV